MLAPARTFLAAILASVSVAAGAADIAGAGAMPAEGAGPSGVAGFTLGLDAPLGFEPAPGDGFGSRWKPSTQSPLQTVSLSLRDVRAVAVAMRQEETPQSPAAPPAQNEGSFGRWLKRHWWVPALVGGALLVTAGESLYDDDDEDDDR